MIAGTTTIERAFQLARLGIFLDVGEIRQRLREEGYFSETICGPALHAQLKLAIEGARTARWHSLEVRGTSGASTVKASRRHTIRT